MKVKSTKLLEQEQTSYALAFYKLALGESIGLSIEDRYLEIRVSETNPDEITIRYRNGTVTLSLPLSAPKQNEASGAHIGKEEG
jgi:hypothetical protein